MVRIEVEEVLERWKIGVGEDGYNCSGIKKIIRGEVGGDYR